MRDDDATRKRYEAVAVAFRQHGRTIFEYVLRRIRDPSLAEDITEDVFVAALKGLPERESDALPWLRTVAHRRVVDALRRAEAERAATELVEAGAVAAADEQEPGLVDTIVGAVEGLPATERAVVTRRLLEDRPFAEIAVELQTTEAACRTRFSRAMRTVRAVLLGAGFVPP